MNKKHQLKIIAVSLYALMASSAWGALGSLQVKSALGEPFSGTVVVSGDEANALLKQGKLGISGAALQAQMAAQGDNVVIQLRSAQPIRDPLLSFGLSVGHQTRQYTALLDPPDYRPSVQAKRPSGQAATAPRQPAATHSRSTVAESGSQKPAVPSGKSVPAAHHYKVSNNERLIDVARKVQPQGLNLAQTMRALVNANPHAFRNGNPDLMYRNATLTIPSADKLRALANVKPAAAATAPAAGKPAETAAPALAASAESASAPMHAATASEVASAPATAAASAPVAVKPVIKPAPQPEAQPQAEEHAWGGWWQWALLGALGILLLLALLLQRRKRSAVQAEMEEPTALMPPEQLAVDEDDVVFMDVAEDDQGATLHETQPPLLKPSLKPTVVAAAGAAVATAGSASDEQQPPQAQAPQAASEPQEDWSWLEDDATDSPVAVEQAVAEPSPATPTTPGKQRHNDEDWLKFDAVEEPQEQEAVAVVQPEERASTDTEALEWLTQDEPVPAAEPVVDADADADVQEWVVAPQHSSDITDVPGQKAALQSAPADKDDVLGFGDFTLATADEPVAPPADVSVGKKDGQTTNVLQPQHQNAFAADDGVALVANDIDWGALGLVDDNAQAVQSPVESELSVAENVVETEPLSWTLTQAAKGDDGVIEDVPVAVQPLAAHAVPVPPAEPVVVDMPDVAPAAEVVLAEDKVPVVADAEQADNEDINMTVPMEAKLELAKMYLEIDDAATARKTLHELVDEANGEVLAEAQKLLSQLGD